LDLDQVGVLDSFLELGGDSLLATQVVSRVLKTFQVDVSLRALLDSPTVAAMSLVITRSQAERVAQQDLARRLAELEALSDEGAKALLAGEKARDDSSEDR
jgi:hypothetical protein